MPITLPADATLATLRRRARTLQRAVRAGDPEALAQVATHHPTPPPASDFPLSAAQLVVARACGFPSWPRLKHHLTALTHYRRDPDLAPALEVDLRAAAGAPGPASIAGPAGQTAAGDRAGPLADEFCRLACLVYAPDDGPHRWAAARDLLAAHPDLPSTHIWAAATAADPSAVERHLAADASLATRQGGPHRWDPLFHLAYSRLDPAVPADRVLTTARLLLAAGADPNAGYLWHGLPTPFTVLTGAFGEGEQGPGRQPRHPHSLPLAELLLSAGANPNDGQSLYNRMFRPDNDHLELLFAHGLGTGTTEPWLSRLGDALETPADMLARQLSWAVHHGFTPRVHLLLAHGATPTPALLTTARTNGHHPIATALHQALTTTVPTSGPDTAPPSDPVTAFITACLSADRAAVTDLLDASPEAAGPDLLRAARAARPALIPEAAEAGREQAIPLLVDLGFDINAPLAPGGGTALHWAAWHGDLPLVRLLIAHGADPHRTDPEYHQTPVGWSRHAHQPATTSYLDGLAT